MSLAKLKSGGNLTRHSEFTSHAEYRYAYAICSLLNALKPPTPRIKVMGTYLV